MKKVSSVTNDYQTHMSRVTNFLFRHFGTP